MSLKRPTAPTGRRVYVSQQLLGDFRFPVWEVVVGGEVGGGLRYFFGVVFFGVEASHFLITIVRNPSSLLPQAYAAGVSQMIPFITLLDESTLLQAADFHSYSCNIKAMKTYHSSLRFVYLPLFALKLLAVSSLAQPENPVQGSNTTVVPGPTDNTTPGEIVPLFWKALIEESIINVPLVSIEHFGVQTYVVDGVARVRELTITTKSQSMIRIYHMSPLKSIAEDTIENLENIIENASGEELTVPVKVFPSTTHAHMVEYRTSELAHIDKLYEHLETAMKDYHARLLVPGQREETVRKVKVVRE